MALKFLSFLERLLLDRPVAQLLHQRAASLRELLDQLTDALRAAGFAIDLRSGQVPHVTLARRVRCPSLPSLETPIRWRVREFALVETRLHPLVASYRALASFPLGVAEAD